MSTDIFISGSAKKLIKQKTGPPGNADTQTYSVVNTLTWTESDPHGARPGLTWTLTGSWNRNDVGAGYLMEPDSYQVFLQLTMNWERS